MGPGSGILVPRPPGGVNSIQRLFVERERRLPLSEHHVVLRQRGGVFRLQIRERSLGLGEAGAAERQGARDDRESHTEPHTSIPYFSSL